MAAFPAYHVGDEVAVLDLGKSGHVRTPFYIRGHRGRIVQYCGMYLNPENLAIGVTSGPAVHLYRVTFPLSTLWPDDAHRAGDQLVIEVYEHWLTPVTHKNKTLA